MISVRQTRALPPAFFRFHLTVDTLALGYTLPTTRACYGRVKQWRDMLVSIACHFKPCMRFSLTRLSDSLLLAAFKGYDSIFFCSEHKRILIHKFCTTAENLLGFRLDIFAVYDNSISISTVSSKDIHLTA